MRRLLWLLLCMPLLPVRAQELPPLENFTPLEYHAGNQNWAIAQDDDGVMYVANTLGLLSYNGAVWSLYPSPNETILRSVQVIGQRIYTGCYQEFGYWQANPMGQLVYQSLSAGLSQPLLEDEEFWNILEIGDKIIFQSLKRIYIYDQAQDSFSTIDSEATLVKAVKADGRLYFQRARQGVYVLEGGQERLLWDDPVFRTDELVDILTTRQGLIIVTRNHGLYQYRAGASEALVPVGNGLDAYALYSATVLSNHQVALGTISNGVLVLNADLQLSYQINQDDGLRNNTVLSVMEDKAHNLWLGLDYGICYVNQASPMREFIDEEGVIGSVYAVAIHNGLLYLGTNQGLFCRPLGQERDFALVPGTVGQVWSLSVLNGTLFCGHHTGTYTVNGQRARYVPGTAGTWAVKPLEDTPYLIQGAYDGLYILQQRQGRWAVRNKVEGFQNSARHFEVAHDRLFVSHEYKGVFLLDTDADFRQVHHSRIDTLRRGANSSIAKYQGDILYADQEGIFRYQPDRSAFVRDTTLDGIYTEANYSSGRIGLVDEGTKFWMFTQDHLTMVTPGVTATPTFTQVPIALEERKDVVEYESVINTGVPGRYIFGTSAGYLDLDVNALSLDNFEVHIGWIAQGSTYQQEGQRVDRTTAGRYSHEQNHFRIHFFTPAYYKFFKPVYQYQLAGLYDAWSDWSDEVMVMFENLPPGEYTFRVRSRIGDKLSDNEATYTFRIAKPWYLSTVMLVVYGLVLIALFIIIHQAYRRYYHRQQHKLIAANEKELALTKAQAERELVAIRNEQLMRENQDKSKELAATTLNLVKQNEVLRQIKDELVEKDPKAASVAVMKIIDEHLDEGENWQLFKEAFDNADQEFFKKLNELHPNLSPNDLKLCAYLRLNLSSKEIAPLLNISPRSVEIKRYRLRKKINLTNDDNLTQYIINI